MRGTIIALGVLAVAGGAAAQEATIAPERVIAVVTTDWNEDGGPDRAVLVESADADLPDAADLHLYLSAAPGEPMARAAFAPAIVWRGAMWGTEPGLELLDNGSLAVTAQNDAIGRDRWRERLTLAFRDGAFVVAGYYYGHHDTLDPANAGECDVNLLTGKGVKDGAAFGAAPTAIPVEAWRAEDAPAQCRPE